MIKFVTLCKDRIKKRQFDKVLINALSRCEGYVVGESTLLVWPLVHKRKKTAENFCKKLRELPGILPRKFEKSFEKIRKKSIQVRGKVEPKEEVRV